MIANISIIDFIKKKYNLYNFNEIIEIFLFGSLFGIVLYFFIYFKNDMLYYIIYIIYNIIILKYFSLLYIII